MKREDDEKLWDLLGHSAQPEVSPFFARNVLRKLREARGDTRENRWFSLRRLIPVAGVAVAILAALFLRLQTPGQNHSEAQPDKWTLTETQDSELIADLDDLISADDNNSWDDTVLL